MNGMFSKGFSIEDSERPGCVSPFTGSGNKRDIKVQKIDQEGDERQTKDSREEKVPLEGRFRQSQKFQRFLANEPQVCIQL